MPTIKHSEPVPFIKVKGSHREIGRQIGEACSRQIQHCVENAHVMIDATYDYIGLDWHGATIQSRKYIPFAQERYPQYVDEMMGMAEGAGISFEDMSVLVSMEAVTSDALHLGKCTSMAVNSDRTTDGHVLLAHNEDWTPEEELDVYIVHAEPTNEPPFLAMTYGGYPVAVGINAHGIAQGCDSVYPTDFIPPIHELAFRVLSLREGYWQPNPQPMPLAERLSPKEPLDIITSSYTRAARYIQLKHQRGDLHYYMGKMAGSPIQIIM